MGAIFRTDDDGNHVSTGKYPYPAGQVHQPEWGEWRHEWADIDMRSCEFGVGACDLDDYRSDSTVRTTTL